MWQDHQSEGTEWIVQITVLLVYGPVNNAYAHFFNGNYFAAKTLADGSVHKEDGKTPKASQQDHTPCPSQRQLCQKGNTSRHAELT